MKNANVSHDRRISMYLCEICAAVIVFHLVSFWGEGGWGGAHNYELVDSYQAHNKGGWAMNYGQNVYMFVAKYSVNVFPHNVPH